MACWPYTTARWKRLRLIKLQQSPLCEMCLRQMCEVVPASVVDHRVPISPEGRKARRMSEGFPPLEGLASLCAEHHNQKSRSEQMGETDWMTRGCDIFGAPLDRDHHWYKSLPPKEEKAAEV